MIMKTKKVTVHIVTYNSAGDIAGCLAAVRQQEYPVAEILVVDNASTDGTREAVLVFGTEETPEPVPDGDPSSKASNTPVRLISNPVNTGFAPAHNQAIAASEADYILVLNPDVTLEPDYVSRLVAVMEANPRIGSATGKLLSKADPNIVDSTGLVMNRMRRAFDRGMGEPAGNWTESGEVFGVSGAAAMYSRRMIEEISIEGEFFDGDFFAYKEDVDVAWRARLLGWTAYYDAEAIAYHERGWKTSGRTTRPLFIRRMSYMNRYKMLAKNEPARSLLTTLLVSLPYELAVHGYMLLREPKVLTAWGSFFRQWSVLRRKRKQIQERRKKV
ncbi:glycosyltransferase family 2 protein [Paenibacillus spiritus]|nr:glycosyltransferase family 2 protein [Paenibacillus spiritus]